MANSRKRRDTDVTKLMMNHNVELVNDSLAEFDVEFRGPPNSPYEGGVWTLHIEIPDEYPFKSPSVRFANRIYHPNVDEKSGTVCLNLINQNWSAMFDLLNVVETFLPQLLLYPNPHDPLNVEAATLLIQDNNLYEQKVKEHCDTYAKDGVPGREQNEENSSDDSSADEYSSSEE